jgi:hypothetical protein
VARPVYHVRTELERSGGFGEAGRSVTTMRCCLELLAMVLREPREEPGFDPARSVDGQRSGPEALVAAVAKARDPLLRDRCAVVRDCVSRELLGRDETKSLLPLLAIDCRDRRKEQATPLPDLPASTNALVLPEDAPAGGR